MTKKTSKKKKKSKGAKAAKRISHPSRRKKFDQKDYDFYAQSRVEGTKKQANFMKPKARRGYKTKLYKTSYGYDVVTYKKRPKHKITTDMRY